MPVRALQRSVLALLALTLLLGLVRAPRPPRHPIGPTQDATNAYLQDVRSDVRGLRPRYHDTVLKIVARYLHPDDAWRVQRCQNTVLRLRHDAHRVDKLAMARCQTVWCPACPTLDWRIRARYQVAKLESVIPGRELVLGHSVWTLPPELRTIAARVPDGITRLRAAVLDTICDVYGVETAAEGVGRAASQRELGIIANLHPFGDEAEPFPQWAPHLDVLLPGVRHTGTGVKRLRATWPAPYRVTQDVYRRALRRQFAPLCQTIDEHHYVGSEFDVVLHIGDNRDRHMVRGPQARAKVWYSCRPHFDLSRAHLEAPDGPAPILVYTPKGGHHIHRRDPKDFFTALYEIGEEHLAGTKAWGYLGNLSRRLYAQTARAAGNEPVVWRPKSGWHVTKRYPRSRDGRYEADAA